MTTTPNLPSLSTCSPWAAPTDVYPACDPATGQLQSSINVNVLDLCCQVASDILFQLAGRQFPGSCEDTVRPYNRSLARDHGRPISGDANLWAGGGYWTYGFSGMGGFSPWDGYTTNQEEMPDGTLLPSIDLGVFPLTSIIQVLIDGYTVDPASYRIDENRHLVRLTEIGPNDPDLTINWGWPYTQDFSLPPTEPNTFEVTFTYGTPPPPAGILACAELAWQLYLSANPGAGTCALPARTTRVQRQGVTVTMLDPETLIANGRIGLVTCDLFLQSVNPKALTRRSTIYSPDIDRRVRRIAPGA